MLTYRRAFISHSHNENAIGGQIHAALVRRGIDAWIDLQDLQDGHFLGQEIQDELRARDAFILLLSPASEASFWVRLETQAYFGLMAQDPQRIMIPVRVASCPIPPFMNALKWIDAIGRPAEEVADEIARALVRGAVPPRVPSPESGPPPVVGPAFPLLASLRQLGFQARRSNGVEVIVPPTVPVPAGEFLMGSNKTQDPEAYDDEQPQYAIDVAAYAMATFPVTVAEYAKYLAANPQVPVPRDGTFSDREWVNQDWRKQTLTWAIQQQQRADHPVVFVSWQNARDYAAWLAKVTGEPWRLPTEAEWEKAARGTDGRIYPWGPKWEKGRANIYEAGSPGMTTTIGTYAERDTTPYGCHDMIGNVWEWCHSIYLPYPFDKQKCDDNADHTNSHVLRGGSWLDLSRVARAALRDRSSVGNVNSYCGFRLVRGVGAGSH